MVRPRFGWAPVFLLNHPDQIEEVLVTQNRQLIKSQGMRAFQVLFGDGLVLSEGDFWPRQRRLMQPAFHQDRIRLYGETMAECTRQAVGQWADGEVRDIHEEMMRLTLDIVARTLFSSEVSDAATAPCCCTPRMRTAPA